jgi:hypothetical protein
MNKLRAEDITRYVEDNIGAFHQKRIDSLSYSNKLNRFTMDFANEFCTEYGAIDWNKLVKFNSEAAK